MLMLPLRVPTAVGLNVTSTAQFAPTPTLPPQLFVWEKSPLAVMLEIVRFAVPVLVKFTVCSGLVVPTPWPTKFMV
jgi:hypothetical protein